MLLATPAQTDLLLIGTLCLLHRRIPLKYALEGNYNYVDS